MSPESPSRQKGRPPFIAAAILGAVVAASFVGWYTVRAAIHTGRHALDAQEGPRDALFLALRPACSGVNGGKFVVPKGHPHHVPDATAWGTGVYRYVVLDAAALGDANCTRALVSTATKLPYRSVVVFSDRGRQVSRFEFFSAASVEPTRSAPR